MCIIIIIKTNNYITLLFKRVIKVVNLTSAERKQLTSILSNLNNFHSLEVVDRVSETQRQVGENSD